MNSGGRVCWRGVSTESLQPRPCHCDGRDPPPFDLVFPSSAGAEYSTVAPSTWANDSLLPGQTTALPTREWRTGGGGGGDIATISSSEKPGGNVAASMHPRSVKLLIGASITLFIIILFLGCLLYCFTKKKKKKRQYDVQRRGPDGCEADRVPYDVPATNHQPDSKNAFPLLQIDEPSHPNNEIPTTRDAISGTDSPFVVRNFPVLRKVKSAVVGIGSPKKVTRPVSRHDSTAPLVEHQASIFRDRWKDKSRTAADDIDANRLSADSDNSDVRHPDRLTTLNENDVNVPNGKLPTKLETLPSRMYPAQSVMETPSSKRSNKRPDSSTPLFDSDSISSSEA
ncbi:uncharacterized protein LOC586461 [Strongylocentrotus purpuratus]|uniref:Uncharacterized protein n=1 Tax=Strongylocentrotus purpuratus TaxID=7668 RepID=A0A7M7RHK8_STRPU|nr:uncharacterized protein LOC586461 [Strongylocentrotus purpuratus]|eukprot:XP_011682548.1 PREDICTED: uncharacterized protein LOC586461 [Strongylocentrotus purpuratus]